MTDVYAEFVAAVAESLDGSGTTDDPATGVTLARRAHLSRFHFDRVISAAAGESPAAFRRRLLLERAAYRLLAEQVGVLEIAVDAGYSSHEAFTRAFTRAYGMSPRTWRREPSRVFFLAAPSGVHFQPPAGLRLPARKEVKGMDVLVRMVEHHVWLTGELIDRGSRLDAAALDRPIELSIEGIDDDVTIRYLLDRLVWQQEMWLASVEDRPFQVPECGREVRTPIPDLRSRHAVAGERFVALINQLNEQGRFDESFVDTTCEPPRVFTYGGMVAHVLTFAAHRRSLLVGAFHSAGVRDLGFGDPMQFVAG
ncbi:transcriptional regulator, AraC family [Kribbella flavida DSM 17836]|uniref:Transcriptional regulator, AraC family n=1 Tax=Kribbella flavida (strain DSM 17836 / JCM 10339 / NBRC 14399) TaxID=479435 RepID=D2PTC9_KRIFD|nr:AraC family transcriptional regulator [Kribbella flavida]ADB29445.1 transcriptional regulator, AraC family [Kribbella flavida DSM 17836]